jgi:hypothetical protein
LDGIGIIIEALGPWKAAGLASAQNTRQATTFSLGVRATPSGQTAPRR